MVSAFLTGLNCFRSIEQQMSPTNIFLENMTGDFMLSDKIWETLPSLPMTTILGRYLHIKENIWAHIWTKKGKGVKTLAGKRLQRQRVRSDSRKEQGLENSVAEASVFPRRKGVRGFQDAQGKKHRAESDASLEGLDHDNPQGPGMCASTQWCSCDLLLWSRLTASPLTFGAGLSWPSSC